MRGFLLVSKIFLLSIAALSYTSVQGQSSLALKNLQRQKWHRAYELLTKATAKDSLNVTAKYVLAQYFFSEDNPAFQLDSAYTHVLGALNDFQKTSEKERTKLLRFPVDSLLLHRLREQIETAAFVESKRLQSEKSWISFIDRFPTSAYIPRAKKQRDSVAFEFATQENTYMAFHDFLQKYPEAEQLHTAQAKYERLLLDAKTSDQSLQSFERFLSEYPSSAYRSFVEQTIFEYKTALGGYNDWVGFIRKYPHNRFVNKAKNILFHLIPERDRMQKWPSEFTSDSLAQAMALENTYLVPFLKNDRYGFMDSKGIEVIAPVSDSLHVRYHCGNIADDIILLPDKVIAATGTCIWNAPVERFDDLGSGFLILQNDACRLLIHKSGFRIGPECIDDATILSGRFAAIRMKKFWSLYTLAGRLLESNLDDVYMIGDVICLKKNNGIRLVTSVVLATLPMPATTDFASYDDAKPWGNNLILVRKQNHLGLCDQELNVIVPLGGHNLTATFFGIIASNHSVSTIYSSQNSSTFRNVIVQDPWLAAKDSVWRLIDPKMLSHTSAPFDTIKFLGSFAVGQRKDSSFIFFNSGKVWKGTHPTTIEFIPGQDSAYLSVEEKGRKSLFNRRGQKLFTATFDKIQFAGGDAFIVHRKDKKGLISKSGKLLLPFEYDAIGTMKDGMISLLNSTKFGLYDAVREKVIKPSYGKNVMTYNSKLLVAFRNELYGFITWDNKPLGKFEFKEIRYWNDTTALVKKDAWMLYEIRTGLVIMDKIKSLTLIRDKPEEKLAIVYQDANHGVVHSHNGIIVPISYSDIINVGSPENPLYFTEKHVEEASLFVVIYYDAQGRFLRKEIYDPDAYDRIYCNSN
jgi:hypothetical protein